MLDLAVNNKTHLTDSQYQKVSQIVYQHCGINLHDGKKELVRSRLAKLLRKHNTDSYEEYLDKIAADSTSDAFTEFINVLTTNLTMFFRESHHFDYLCNEIVPRLIYSKNNNGKIRVRAWSAGCSSGEEPYSIAMCLNNEIKDINRWDVKILATDISSSILQKAKEGVYDKEKVANIPISLKAKYTKSVKNDKSLIEIESQIKNQIAFKYLNLIQNWPVKGPFDFIFCRNVMIYFDKQTQQKLINKFWDVLAPGGVLFTGHSESLTGIEHSFKYTRPTIYIKD